MIFANFLSAANLREFAEPSWRPLHMMLWVIFGITVAITAVWGFQAMAEQAGPERCRQVMHEHDWFRYT